jgi:ABC-type uncharacterized transport system auxiliary subunit
VALSSGRIVDVAMLSARAPVATSGAASVVAALDEASADVMTQIVRFVVRRL